MNDEERKVATGAGTDAAPAPASPAQPAGEAQSQTVSGEAEAPAPASEAGDARAGAPAAAADAPAAAPESPAPESPAPESPAPGSPEPQDPGEGVPAHDQPTMQELMEKAGRADEYLDMAKRARADFENFRKRAARDAALAQERGYSKLARELMPAIDNLERALAAVDAAAETSAGAATSADAGLVSGIRLVHTDVIGALQRVGIESFSPKGERFDPAHHEAVAQQPIEGADPGTVVEVYQRGYRLGDSVLRPARVLVAG